MNAPRARNGLPQPWLWLSISAASLAAAGSIVGLRNPALVYGKETAAFFDASIAQDIVNLFLVAPVSVVLGILAFHGSLRSWLCLLGFLAFTAYNYAIYAFSIHFGPLFLVWVAVLGLSVYAFAGSAAALHPSDLRGRLGSFSVRLPGWFLVATAVLFTYLWLSEILPDLLAGGPSTSATTWNVPSNPVHVLDLAIFLPGVFVVGLLLLRRHQLGRAFAPNALIFLGLTTLPIILTPFVAQAEGHAPDWSVLVPIGIIALATLALLWRLLHNAGKKSDLGPGGTW